MTVRVDQLRSPTAWRLLAIWRETRELAEEPLERGLLCNARVLAESCFWQGEPVFADGADVLRRLTGREMEDLLRRLSGEGVTAPSAAVNPDFDQARFLALRGRSDGVHTGGAAAAAGGAGAAASGRPGPGGGDGAGAGGTLPGRDAGGDGGLGSGEVP